MVLVEANLSTRMPRLLLAYLEAEGRDWQHFLDRLGRSLRDLLDIADQIQGVGASLTVGRSTYDPADPAGAMMFHVLGMTAEFEVAMNRERTREAVARAKAEGKYRGRQPKLSPATTDQ